MVDCLGFEPRTGSLKGSNDARFHQQSETWWVAGESNSVLLIKGQLLRRESLQPVVVDQRIELCRRSNLELQGL